MCGSSHSGHSFYRAVYAANIVSDALIHVATASDNSSAIENNSQYILNVPFPCPCTRGQSGRGAWSLRTVTSYRYNLEDLNCLRLQPEHEAGTGVAWANKLPRRTEEDGQARRDQSHKYVRCVELK